MAPVFVREIYVYVPALINLTKLQDILYDEMHNYFFDFFIYSNAAVVHISIYLCVSVDVHIHEKSTYRIG